MIIIVLDNAFMVLPAFLKMSNLDPVEGECFEFLLHLENADFGKEGEYWIPSA